MKIGEAFQTADWKSEKHVPVIECEGSVTADEPFGVKISLGKEVAHPNTTEHHIRWVRIYFKPNEEKFTYEVGNFEFNAHGESVQGANSGPVYTDHTVTLSMKINKPGQIIAASYCNIHGLWENFKEISVK